MRRTPISSAVTVEKRSPLDNWIDLEDLAALDVSSEDPLHRFEDALGGSASGGWRAAAPGPQTIRIQFDIPRSVRRIRLEFRESTRERSQEFHLSAISSGGERHEIARQQWNFSPGGSTIEVEDYVLQLANVEILELAIDPGRHDRQAVASLQSIAVA